GTSSRRQASMSASSVTRWSMAADLIALAILAVAAVCWTVVASPELPPAWRWLRRSVGRWVRVDKTAVDLSQAGLARVPPWAWIVARWCLAAVAGLVAYTGFGLVVLGLVAALAAYHLAGLGLEARRRQAEASRQRALLEAMRFGVSVMSRSGGA